jgi:hypothetical protein
MCKYEEQKPDFLTLREHIVILGGPGPAKPPRVTKLRKRKYSFKRGLSKEYLLLMKDPQSPP